MWQEQALRSTPEPPASAAGLSLGALNSVLGPSARTGAGPDNVWGDPFEGIAGGSDQAPSDQQPDHYLRDEPMEDAESAQPSEVQIA